jgi:hypothetical protein
LIRWRVQQLLGLTRSEAELLTERARAGLGTRGYMLRAAAFLLATMPLLRRAIPRRFRVRAVRPLLYGLLPSPSENLFYALPNAGGSAEVNA